MMRSIPRVLALVPACIRLKISGILTIPMALTMREAAPAKARTVPMK
jgi:hypothetical protein